MKQDNKETKTKSSKAKAKPETNTKPEIKPETKPKTKSPKTEPKLPSDKTLNADKRDLNLEGSRTLISKVLLGFILFCLTFFFARTAIWEYNYYKEKEGSERATAETVSEPEPVDETEVTVEQRAEYSVPANHPRYLTIEKLGIYNSRVLSMGINSLGELDTPRNIFDVGWYNQSGKPGYGDVLVIDGHNGGPNIEGVFKHINQLYNGDEIVVERGDGEKFVYTVVDNKEIPIAEANNYMHVAFSTPVPGQESLTLISCIGEWSQIQGTYLSRQFVRAVLKK
ncbi:class F sortase [Candidatus Saccharibacteria bacterium]|nr:class F sortase [Candidatus Saccharibacteria bacterium]